MNKHQLESYFSSDRLSRYFDHYPGNEPKAICLYDANMSISEALYTPLSILEVALRNKINLELERKYGRADWYAEWYKHPVMHNAWTEVNGAIKHLHNDGKPIVPDKVVASLMFGFWTSLFNDRYERELWSNFRFIFPHMPKAIRKRNNVSKPLNDIRRSLRNRIYHNEPIIFNTVALTNHYNNITMLLDWMGTDLLAYNNMKQKFTSTLADVTAELSKL